MDFPIADLAVPVFEELVMMIGSFTDDNFNEKPAPGEWSAGQVVKHVKLSCGNILPLLESVTIETERDPQEHIDKLRSIFMDFGYKMKSPEFITPKDKLYDRQSMADFFFKLKADLQDALEDMDLSLTCQDFTMPGFPPFTRVEWLAFTVFHTQRHIHQLRGISAKV